MKATVLGNVMKSVDRLRRANREKVINELWSRNGLEHVTQRSKHTIDEVKTISADGTEVTTFKLWHLVDQTTVTIKPQVEISVEEGVGNGPVKRTSPSDHSSPI